MNQIVTSQRLMRSLLYTYGNKAEHKLLEYNGNKTEVARTIKLVKASLQYTRMESLENNLNSIIWITLKLKDRDHILVCSEYWQWTLPSKLCHNNNSFLLFQKQHFVTYLDWISSALKMKLPIVLMHDVQILTFYVKTRPRSLAGPKEMLHQEPKVTLGFI